MTARRLSRTCCTDRYQLLLCRLQTIFFIMPASTQLDLSQPLLKYTKPKMLETIPLIALNSNPTGSLREGKRVMERMWRWRWRSRRRHLGGGRGTPRVSSPSYPSDGQGRLLPSKDTHPSLLRKEEEEKKSLPLNDVGCVSYLTVGWISSTMWKAFRVLSSAQPFDDCQPAFAP